MPVIPICLLTVVLQLLICLSWGLSARLALPHYPDCADNIGRADYSAQLGFGPIDVVYTWVNGSDLRWKRERDYWYQRWILEPDRLDPTIGRRQEGDLDDDGNAARENRFRDNDELRYSLRSLEKYAPWVRRIHLVTDGQVPTWLDLDNDRIRVVKHSDIFENTSHLPVFSSSAIESNLDRIPGLSDLFLYFNDDVFLGAPVWPEDFITPSGVQCIYLSHPVPLGDYAYPEYWSGDGFRARASNISACGWDLDDCGCLDDEHGGVKCEQLVGEAFFSPICEMEQVVLPPLLDKISQSQLSLEHNHTQTSDPWSGKNSDADGIVMLGINTTKSTSALHSSSQIKIAIASLLDALQCHKKQDLVADAIRYVIKTFNAKFSRSRHLRRVPSHMPHMINKQILRELKALFPQQFQETAAHRFRHSRDLQFSFSYFNYLINRHNLNSPSLRELWDQYLDINHDGRLDENEVLTLASLTHGDYPPADFHESVRSCLYNDSELTNETVSLPRAREKVTVVLEDVERCINISRLRSHVRKEKSYILKMGTDVTFHMLSDDYQTALNQLQSVRARRTKFICLNDDMKDPSAEVKLALTQLLKDLWPTPSRFELPPSHRTALDILRSTEPQWGSG
jgi:UDP-N-acetylglucosamine-lysosomal-enzyme